MRCVFVIVLLLLSSSCFAAEKKGINFRTVITDQYNVPYFECVDLTDKDCTKKRFWTLGAVVARALSNAEANTPPEQSLARGKLALRLLDAENESLKAEDITLIKNQIAKLFNPIVVAKTFALLDPNSE